MAAGGNPGSRADRDRDAQRLKPLNFKLE